MSDNPKDLFGALSGAPTLAGARCRGHWNLFDPREDREDKGAASDRHEQALGLCRLCPALTDCSEWFDSLPRAKRPQGVIAGRVYPAPARTKEVA
ncbi:hypothetical protein FIV07_01995 [Mycobacterium sp. THAF192]|nr:hypothetical protein FIV07_01995 [Mycobacterium sp. THAF192]